jgi:prepilin-type N-terminal cleavage/methylation domain-containing protein
MIRKGFTLVEVAVVLVIIGILAGSVLVGRDLIHTAEILSTARQYQQFATATNAFKLKYDCLPGDCKEVVSLGFNPLSAGNGDDLVGQCATPGERCTFNQSGNTLYWENLYYWYQLSAAGLIGETIGVPNRPPFARFDDGAVSRCWFTLDSPANPIAKLKMKKAPMNTVHNAGWAFIDAVYDVSQSDGAGSVIQLSQEQFHAHAFLLSPIMSVGTSGNVCSTPIGGYPAMDLFRMDSKIDDGKPTTGTFRAVAITSTIGDSLIYQGLMGPIDPIANYCLYMGASGPEYLFINSDFPTARTCGALMFQGAF